MSYAKSPAKNASKSMKSRVAIFAILLLTATASIILYRTQAATSDPDPTFLSAGKVSLNLPGNNNDYAEEVEIQADGKVVVGGGDADFRIVRYNADGNLDQTFGVNGVVTIDFGATESLYDIAIQADGKIVAVGAGNVQTSDRYFAVVRLNTNGTLDTSFDGDGKANINTLAGGSDYPSSVAIQADQKIVVAGNTEPSGLDTVVIRLNTNGSLDTSFDGDGVKSYSISSGTDYANDVLIQPDQKILLGGITYNGSNLDFVVSRLNPNGTFDTSFDSDGIASTGITSSDDRLLKLALQSDGKILGSGYGLASGSNNDFTMVRFNTNGSLDTTFDGDGRVQTDFGLGRDDVGRKLAIQSDGKIVQVGETNTVNGSRYDYGVVRYNTDGSLDTTFDGDGKLTAQFNANNSISTDVAVQPDNKIVVVGRSNWQTVDFGAMRFNPNGSLDTTWGAGKINLDLFNGIADEGRAVARQTDGKLIVVGRYLNGSNFAAAVARYNTNGTIDTTFGSGGKVTTQINSTYPQAVAMQTDGKIVVAGFIFTGANYDFLLLRYNTNGTLDTSFDGDGIVTLNITVADLLYGVAIQPDGKIVAVGTLFSGSDQYVVLRYNTDGSPDTTFDADGRANTDITGGHDAAYSVAIQPDGKIVAAGYSTPSTNDFSIARYNTNGSLDTSFNGVGYSVVPIGSAADVVHAVVLQPDGKIVVAGNANGGASADDFALARFNTNGTLDTSFDIDGKLTTSFSNSNDQAFGIVIQPDGKILMSGHAYNGHTNDFAFARYNADGSPDNTFNGNGRRFLDFSGYNDSDANITGNNMILQPDGKAVVVSTTNNGINTDIGIARINLEDPSPGAIQFNASSFSVNETTNTATITVARSGGLGTVTVDYATSDGTATAGSDYTATSGTLTFNDGEFLKTFTIPILDDVQTEGNETVNLALSNPTGGAGLGAQTTATLTIIDNTEPTIHTAGYELRGVTTGGLLAGKHLSGITIDPTNGNIYVATDSRTIPLPTGDPCGSGSLSSFDLLKITPTGVVSLVGTYNIPHGDLINLEWGPDGQIYTGNHSTNAIHKIDPNTGVSSIFNSNVGFSLYRYGIEFDPSGNLIVSPEAVTTFYRVSSSSVVNMGSYTPDGTGNHGDRFGIQPDGDYVVYSDNQTIAREYQVLTSGHVDGTPYSFSYLSGTDVRTLGSSYVHSNGAIHPVTGDVYTSGGNCSAGSSVILFTPGNGTLSSTTTQFITGIGNGQTGGSTWPNSNARGVTDLDFGPRTDGGTGKSLYFLDDYNDVVYEARSTAVPGSVQFSSAAYNVNENGVTATITVTRTNGSDGAVSVDYLTSNGTALSGSDFTNAGGTLNWANSDSSDKTFTVPILDDGIFEGNETVNLSLGNVLGGAVIGAPSTAVLTILDNETQPTVSINDVSIVEGNSGTSTAIFTVSLSNPSTQTVTVDYATANVTATAGSDYVAASGTLTFNPGETNKPVNITINGDTLVEPDEGYGVQIISVVNGTIADGNGEGTITNDDAGGSMEFSSATYSVNEGNTTATITVMRTGGAASGVTVDYTTSDGTALAGNDYTTAFGQLVFAANETSKTFDVTILDDNDFESNETVNLTLSNPQGGGSLGTQTTAVLTINETDTCSYSIAPTSQNFGLAGGNNSVGVTVINGCGWTAVSNDSWISVTGGSSGNGNGTVNYSVAANNGLARTGTITIAGQTFTVTQDAGCLNVSVPTGLTALKNSTLTVPVNVNDTSGRGVLSFDFTLTYDPAVLTPLATPFDTASTLSNGYTITFNSSIPGTLVVSGFGTTALTGSGTLINLKFDVIGNPADCSNLNLSAFQFNEGTPCVVTTNGQACVINGTISGNVSYVNGMPTQPPVKNVTLTAVGASTITSTTDTSGNYAITGFANGAYTVTPTKTGDANGITAFDASLNAQHVVGLITLNANQQIAADVSNNGTLTSFDSALIAQYVVSIPNTGITGTWKFVPASRNYANVITDQTNQNYDAILMGEISGNWTPPTSFSESQKQLEDASNAIGVSLPDQPTTPNSNITIPITVQDTTGKGIVAYEFDLTYDPNILQLQSQPVDASGTLSNGMLVTVNAATSGLLKVAVFGTTPMNGAGSLLKLKFTAIGAVGSISPLTWQRFLFNENTPQNVTTNGQVRIAQPTAAAGNVCGRITSQSGKPLEGVVVKLYEVEAGEGTKTVTNGKGSYCFGSVVIGVDYVIQPFRKGYDFTPSYRLLTLTGSRDDIDFGAIPAQFIQEENDGAGKPNRNESFFKDGLEDFFLNFTEPKKHLVVWRDGNLFVY